jgi:hypothetical protein
MPKAAQSGEWLWQRVARTGGPPPVAPTPIGGTLPPDCFVKQAATPGTASPLEVRLRSLRCQARHDIGTADVRAWLRRGTFTLQDQSV